MRKPLVLVPGSFATELWLGERRVWPPKGLGWLSLHRIADPEVRAGGPVVTGGWLEVWGGLLDFLRDELGYRMGEDLFFFGYSFFTDVDESARSLTTFLHECHARTGRPLVVVATSLGAMLTRLAVDRDGANAVVERLVLLGPVDRGWPEALPGLVSGHVTLAGVKRTRLGSWLRRVGFRVLRARFRAVPAFYQLVPVEAFCSSARGGVRPHDDTSWVTGEGETRARRLAWLSAGRRMQEALAGPPTVPTSCLYGAGEATVSWCFIPAAAAGLDWKGLQTWHGAGDGTLPAHHARSADLSAGMEVYWTFCRHYLLFGDPLAHALIRRALARPAAEEVPDWVRAHVQALQRDDVTDAAVAWAGREVIPIPWDGLHPAADVRAVLCAARSGVPVIVHGDEDAAASAPGALWHLAQRWRTAGDPVPLYAELAGDAEPLGADGLLALLAANTGGRSSAEFAAWLGGAAAIVIVIVHAAADVTEVRALAGRFPNVAFVVLDPDRAALGAWPGATVWARPVVTRAVTLYVRVRRGVDAAFPVRIGVDGGEEEERAPGGEASTVATRSRTAELHWPLDPHTGSVLPLVLTAALHAEGFQPATVVATLALRPEAPTCSAAIDLRPLAGAARRLWVEFYAGAHRVGGLDAPLSAGGDHHLDAVAFARLLRAARSAALGAAHAQAALSGDLPERLRAELAAAPPGDPLDRALRAMNGWPADDGGSRWIRGWIEQALRLVERKAERRALLDALDTLATDRVVSPALRAPAPDRRRAEEALVDDDDMLPFRFLERALAAGRGVARVQVTPVRNGVVGLDGSVGTAWLLSPSIAVTNYHVVAARQPGEAAPTREDLAAQVAGAWLRFGYDDQDARDSRVPATLLYADSHLDFALLRIGPGLPADAAPLAWTSRKVTVGGNARPLVANIIQHPGGGAKRVALRNNLVTSTTETELRYFTDTEPGSSGSPVLGDDLVAIGLHRKAGLVEKTLAGRSFRYNVGITLSAIVRHVRDHDDALAGELAAHDLDRAGAAPVP